MMTSAFLSLLASASITISGEVPLRCDLQWVPETRMVEGQCNANAWIEIVADGRFERIFVERSDSFQRIDVPGTDITEVTVTVDY